MQKKFLLFWMALIIIVSGAIYGFNYKKNASNTAKATTAVCTEMKNCPKKGQADCPLLKDCPLKGTAECPLTGGTPSCCVKK